MRQHSMTDPNLGMMASDALPPAETDFKKSRSQGYSSGSEEQKSFFVPLPAAKRAEDSVDLADCNLNLKRSTSGEDLPPDEPEKEVRASSKDAQGHRSESPPLLVAQVSKDSESVPSSSGGLLQFSRPTSPRSKPDGGGSNHQAASEREKSPPKREKSPPKGKLQKSWSMEAQDPANSSSKHKETCAGMAMQGGRDSAALQKQVSCPAAGAPSKSDQKIRSDASASKTEGLISREMCAAAVAAAETQSSSSSSSSSSMTSGSGDSNRRGHGINASDMPAFVRRVSKNSAASEHSQAWSAANSLQNKPSTRVPTFQALDVHNLDAMHTDQLFQACGLSKQKPNMERRVSNASACSSVFSPASVSNMQPSASLQERRHSCNSRTSSVQSPENQSLRGALASDDKTSGMNFESVASLNKTNDFASLILPVQVDLPPGLNSTDTIINSVCTASRESAFYCRSSRRSSSLMSDNGRVSCGMDALRAEHESMLVQTSNYLKNIADSEDSFPEPQRYSWWQPVIFYIPKFLMCVLGVLPFQVGNLAFWYSNVVQICVVFLLGYSFMLAVRDTDSLYIHLTTVCYALGGLIGAILLRMRRIQDLLGPHDRHLELYARNFDFFEEWQEVSIQRFCVVLALWICSVISRVMAIFGSSCPDAMGGNEDRNAALAPLISFVVISGLLSVLTYCQLHVCCGLEMAIDKFCHRLYLQKDLGSGIIEWNVLQAMLRRSANTIDSCFLAQSTSVLATVLLTGVEVMQSRDSAVAGIAGGRCAALWCGWVLPPMLLVIYTVFRAAAVTEKCCRVPALVNSWPFTEEQIDNGRQYVVEYITHSAAGFYVKGVRLSAFMAFKLTYLFGVVMFTLITQAVLRS